MTLLRWAGRTVLIVAPVFFIATLITFLLGAVSGLDPAASVAGDSASPELIASLNAQFGLDQPIVVQYLTWIGGVLHGDFGVSWFNRIPVSQLIFERLAVSASVAGLALLIGITFGTALGLTAAVLRGTWVDRGITMFATLISTLPAFVVAIGLILLFSITLRWVPSGGYVPPTEDFGAWLSLIILPAVALSVDTVAELARQLRTGLVGTLSENYIIGARVRGLGSSRILFGHALRNGAGPAVAILGMKIPTLLGGAIITETIFSMPGFGLLAGDSALRGDVPVVQGTLVVAILIVLFFNVLVNAALGALRPASRRAA